MMKDPVPHSDEVLLAYVLGDLDAAQRDQIERELQSDQPGRARVSWLRQLLGDVKLLSDAQRRGLFEVSEKQQNALAGLAAQIAKKPDLGDVVSNAAGVIGHAIDRVAALLVFDSARAHEAAVGFRGAVAERLLRFEFDGGSIDLRMSEVAAGDKTVLLQGEVELIAAGMSEGASVQLFYCDDHKASASAVANAQVLDGYFELRANKGRFRLMLTFSTAEIMLQPIDIEQM